MITVLPKSKNPLDANSGTQGQENEPCLYF